MKMATVKAVDPQQLAPARRLVVDGMRYTMGHQVGIGAFSRVYQARDEWDNALVVKVYPPGANPALWQNEVLQLRQFAGPAVVYLHRVFQHEGYTYLVLDDAGVSVSRCIFSSDTLRLGAALFLAKGMLQALSRIHAAGHFHGDINPQNVLVRLNERQQLEGLALVDFALCRPQAQARNGPVAMAQWVPPPEYWLKAPMSGAALDIWHVGALMLQVIKGTPLVCTQDDVCQNRLAQEAQVMASPAARVLATALARDPAVRPDALSLWRALRASVAEAG